MATITSIIIGAVQLIAGIILLATGVASGLGLKLILSGALSLVASFMSGKTGRDGLKSSPRYGFDNLTNGGREGGPIPVVYGQEQIAPTIISTNLKTDGATDAQVLYLLCLIAEGEIDSISDVRLNDTPIESFLASTWDYRLGTADQTAFADFGQIGEPYDAGTRLEKDQTHVHEMHASADEVVLALVWPGGLYRVKDSGDLDDQEMVIRIDWKVTGAADSTYQPFGIPLDAAGKMIQGDWNDYGSGIVGRWFSGAGTRSQLRRQIRLPLDGLSGRPARGSYTIKATGLESDTGNHIRVPTVQSVIEIQNDSRAYAGKALIALKIPGVAQLSGSVPRVTCVVKGRKVYDPRTGLTAWSDNPALCLRDLLLNATFGLGEFVTSGMIDDGVGGTWRTVADACDASVTHSGVTEARWKMGYVIDTVAPGFDHLTQMCLGFRATLYAADGLIRIGQDVASASVRDFEDRIAGAVGNRRNVIHEGGASGFADRSLLIATTLEESNRTNVVRVNYVDSARAWKKRVIEIRNKSISIGAVTGTFVAGEKFKGATSGGYGYFVHQQDGRLWYVQEDGQAALVTGEVLTGADSGSTVTSSSAPTTAESPERPLELNLFGVTRRLQAIREARYHLNRALLTPLFAQWGIGLGDIDLLPGDVVTTYTDAPMAWSGKKFTVLTAGFGQDGRGALTAREYDPDVYTDTVDRTIVDAPPTTSAPSPGGTPPTDPITFGNGDPAAPFGGTPTTTPPGPAPEPAPPFGTPAAKGALSGGFFSAGLSAQPKAPTTTITTVKTTGFFSFLKK